MTSRWLTAEWRRSAERWLDTQLAVAGVVRTGEIAQPHVRPWGTVLKAPTTNGLVWLKAAEQGTAFEAGLYEVLVRAVPEYVLTPIATDVARGWILLPHGGATIAERGADTFEALMATLPHYGLLQRALEPRVDALLGTGVPDMRPEVMMQRFNEAIGVVTAICERRRDSARAGRLRRVAALEPAFASWCQQLKALNMPATLDHNDLHPSNILQSASAGPKYLDWGDSVVAHPFASMLVPLSIIRRGGRGRRHLARTRDAYLEVFTDIAPLDELIEGFKSACRIGKVARALTWCRALEPARDRGDLTVREWESAPIDWLASLLDPSYLGGF